MRTSILSLMASTILLAFSEAKVPNYGEDIFPILREYCAGCHNAEDFEGEFSVESFAALMTGGEEGAVVVPGDSAASRILHLVTGSEKPRMPPRKEPQPPAEAIETLKVWIDAGAVGPTPAVEASLGRLDIPEIAPQSAVDSPVTALAYRPDGGELLVGTFEHVRAHSSGMHWKLGDGKINALQFTPGGEQLLVASGIAGVGGRASLWSFPDPVVLRDFGRHRDAVYDAELAPDGALLATAGYDRDIQLWETASGKRLRTLRGHNGAVFDLAFHPSGAILASASADETVKIWRVDTGERLDTLNQPQKEQYAIAFTRDGKFLVAGGADNRLRMWEVVSLESARINPLRHARFAHEGAIVRIAITPDDSQLISTAEDRTLKVWDLPDLTLAASHGQQSDVVGSLVVHPQGQRFAVGRLDGSVEEIPLGPGSSLPAAPESVAEVPPSPAESAPPSAPATAIQLPVEISGRIGAPGEVDRYAFTAAAGESWVLEVDAAEGSPIDTRVSVLDARGAPVERVRLQALRDSWFTFRGKDSETSDDFRLHNWQEMELNEYLYTNGEVNKLWLYPRGPDSGFKVYPGFGLRRTFFGTSALSHPLGAPCFIVTPLARDEAPWSNGLPVFSIYYENDDDPLRRRGSDSVLLFSAPESEGARDYQAAIEDVRGLGGEDYGYVFRMRAPEPRFELTLEGANPTVHRGSGREFTLSAQRYDGFDAAIEIDLLGLPSGFTATSPLVIEAGQTRARGVLHAEPDAQTPPKGSTRFSAHAHIGDRILKQEIDGLGAIKLADGPKVQVEILPDENTDYSPDPAHPLTFTIRPGETITARVRARRNDFAARIELGGDDSGRNLAHGVYIDNIGLNGLLIVEGETERTFYITAAKWVAPSSRPFHLLASADGGQASLPAILHVVEASRP